MSTFQQYNQYPWLTPVRLVATSNQSGTYFNGPVNNGVGATLTYATGALTIDSVAVNVGDRILLSAQSSANQNGVYVCTQAGATGVSAILQRSADQQCIEQLLTGQYVTVAAGSVNAGGAFVLVEPKPAHLGIDNLSWASQVAVGAVTFSGPASSANALAVFADTAGNLKAASTTTTLGQSLSVTGSVTGSTGLVAGASGSAASVISFPATAANGRFIIAAANAGGAFDTTVSNGPMGQSTAYTIGDIGASTGAIPVSTSAARMKWVAAAAAAGGAADQSFTDAFCTSTSAVIGNWNTQANAASVLHIVPGNGSFVVTSSADAGVGTFQYLIIK